MTDDAQAIAEHVIKIVMPMVQRVARETLQQAAQSSTILPIPVWRPGTVGIDGAPGDTQSVVLDGDVDSIYAQNMTGAYLAAGQRVMVMKLAPHGAFITAPIGRLGVGIVGIGSTGTVTPGSAGNPSGMQDWGYNNSGAGNTLSRIAYTKLYTQSLIVGIGWATWYLQGLSGSPQVLALRIDDPAGGGTTNATTDLEMAHLYYNEASSHKELSGFAVRSGLAAGLHSFKLGWWDPGAPNNPTVDFNDGGGLLIAEVLI